MQIKPFFWSEFGILLGAGLLGVLAIIPYSLTLYGAKLEKAPIPLPLLLSLQFLQNAFFVAIAVGLGLLLARKIDLGAPLLEGWLAGQEVSPKLRTILAPAVLLGLGTGVILLLLEIFLFLPRLPELTHIPKAPIWQKFLASLYGGITEEIFMRLFLFSLFSWLLGKVWYTPAGLPTSEALWTANVLTALLFGLAHLPATAALISLTPLVVTRALLLNGLASLAFGYLYWRHGLEAAMLAHFTMDIVFHVVGASFLKSS